LAALVDEAGLSHAGLARRVNERMTARRCPSKYNHSSVARWISGGATPQGDVPHVLADVLAQRLGRPVRLADVGWAELAGWDSAAVGMEWAHDLARAVDIAVELWTCEVDRKELIAAASAGAATSEVALRWLVSPPDERAERDAGRRRVGLRDVEAVRAMRRHLKAIDDTHGGVAALPMGVEYLRREVAPLLRGSYDDSTGRALFGVVAEVTLAVGWMAYDSARQGLARRYMVQALRLSHAAGDRLFGGRAVAAMSHQALHLGDVSLAIDLARAARAGTAGAVTPTAAAMFAAMEACAQAAAGEAGLSVSALRDAERAFARSDRADDPDWIDFDEGGLAGHPARAFRDLGQYEQAERYAAESIALCQPSHVRTRVQRQAILASAQAQAGRLDEARATGQQAAAEARGLRSVRARDDVARLNRLLAPGQPAAG
jgi:hypothetical protein